MREGCFTTRNIVVGTTYIQIHMVNEGWVGGGGCEEGAVVFQMTFNVLEHP